jgi:flavin-dependent dehydrogenase
MTDADYVSDDRADLLEFWQDSLRLAPHSAQTLGSEFSIRSVRALSAHTAWLERVCGPGWMAVGDAAVSYDPLSSRGICKALESASQSAEAASRWLRERIDVFAEYSGWIKADIERYRQDYLHYYQQVTRWPDSRFWKRRMMAD